MKIRLFIVTYNNFKELNKTLNSIFSCDLSSVKCEVNIINNHSNFSIEERFKNKVKVLHNVLRPDFSTGYLSRNWNQALILGFENLKSPACDIVIACQDDTHFYPNWLQNLLKLHEKYTFITYGWGDNFMSWKPEAVRRIGLWDERFMFNGHSSDYFLRSLLLNREKSSINDYYHKRVLNEEKIEIAKRPHSQIIHKKERSKYKDYGLKILHHKWERINKLATKWNKEFIRTCPAKIKNSQYIMYPYFEENIDYSRQNVIIGEAFIK